MPKPPDMGLTKYLKEQEKARRKAEERAAKIARESEKRKLKTKIAREKAALHKAEYAKRKALDRLHKRGGINVGGGLVIRKKKQGHKLSRRAAIKAW